MKKLNNLKKMFHINSLKLSILNYSILCFLAVTFLLSCGEKKLEATVELDTKKPIHTTEEYTVGPATNLSEIDSFYLSKIADTQYLMNKKRNFNAAIALLEEAKSLGEFEEAQKEIQSDVWLTLGNVAFVKGMFEAALSYYIEGMDIRETMTRLTHGSVLGYRTKASILQNLGRFEEAMEKRNLQVGKFFIRRYRHWAYRRVDPIEAEFFKLHGHIDLLDGCIGFSIYDLE